VHVLVIVDDEHAQGLEIEARHRWQRSASGRLPGAPALWVRGVAGKAYSGCVNQK
jgi:hypothetical protein